jgi:hypothetical protein
MLCHHQLLQNRHPVSVRDRQSVSKLFYRFKGKLAQVVHLQGERFSVS